MASDKEFFQMLFAPSKAEMDYKSEEEKLEFYQTIEISEKEYYFLLEVEIGVDKKISSGGSDDYGLFEELLEVGYEVKSVTAKLERKEEEYTLSSSLIEELELKDLYLCYFDGDILEAIEN